MASSDRTTRLTNIRDNLEKELEDHLAERRVDQAAGRGERTTYSAGGRNVDWNGYLAAMNKAIADANANLAKAGVPWEVRSRARSR